MSPSPRTPARTSRLSRAIRLIAVTASCIAALAAFTSNPATASTAYGDLNNFDVFNDTGKECHGFEIELDDIHSTDITYTFDWNHYGPPTITEDNTDPLHPKVFVRYAAKFNSSTNSFSAYTAVPGIPPLPPPSQTNGHQCTDTSVNIGCEHFGVGHYGAPTVIRYNWLIEDPASPGTLIHGPAVNVATPSWTYYPPAPAQPVALVQAVILAPPPPPVPQYEFGDIVVPGMSAAELVEELLYYGVSTLSLEITGSEREGLRICVSQVPKDQFGILDKRLKKFSEDHPVK